MIHLLLVLLALGAFAAAAFGLAARFNLVAVGLFLWLLAETLGSRLP